jgi:D-alanyl-D-alanine carboxypeptidase (penicillin-binding protein 5/6)
MRLLVAMVIALASVTMPVSARPAEAATPVTTAPSPPPPKAWILVDGDTGNVIDAGNARVRMPPASLTKVVTALAASQLPPDQPITISDRAAAAPADKLFMKPGSVWTADEMIRALLLSSANDAAIALAEQVGGSVEGFQRVMARVAQGLGMADSPILLDPAGLDGPDGVGGGNFMSARDLAIAGRALLSVPTLASIVATTVYYFDGPDNVHHRLTNHNKPFLTTYGGAIGLKTGYTSRAGGCLMAAARVNGRTMLAVVLNGANPNVTAQMLLDKGFATPVSSEDSAERLPAVNGDPLHNAVAAPGDSSSPAATVPAARPSRAGASTPAAVGASAVTPTWLAAVAAGLGSLLLLAAALRMRVHHRRRRRRRTRSADSWSWEDQERAA